MAVLRGRNDRAKLMSGTLLTGEVRDPQAACCCAALIAIAGCTGVKSEAGSKGKSRAGVPQWQCLGALVE